MLFLRLAKSLKIYTWVFSSIMTNIFRWWFRTIFKCAGWCLCTMILSITIYVIRASQFASWFLYAFRTSSIPHTRSSTHFGRGAHRKMIRRGINYLFRFDQRLLILISLQITPSWAAFHHSGNSWFFGVTKKSLSASQASVRFVKLLNDIRSFIFPREIVPWIGLAILVAYIIPASVRFGVKYLNISFERVRNKYRTNKIKLSNDKIKVRLPRKLANKKINFSIRKNHAMRKSVYTILKRVVCLESDHFDSDSTNFEYGATSCVLDNSANSHIWNKKEDFVRGTLHPLKELASVATIGGSNFYPKGIGDLNVKIRDDNNMTSELVLKNVLYFPNSPVNIISVFCLADHFNDDHGISVLTSRNTSVLIWDNSKFRKTLRHSNNRLPEISVNEGVCSGENVKIKNLPQASTYCTSKTILPEDLSDSTKAFLDSTDLFYLIAGSNRRATRELLHTNQDANFDAALKEKLIQAEQYKIGDTVRYILRMGVRSWLLMRISNSRTSTKLRNINYAWTVRSEK